MKYLILLLLVWSPLSFAEVDCEKNKVYCQIIKHIPKLKGKRGMNMSNSIFKQCTSHKVNCQIYTAILIQESRLNLKAKNCRIGMVEEIVEDETTYVERRTCFDFGISQINFKTIKSFKFSLEKLTTNLDYSIAAGAKVLYNFKRMYGKREDKWWSRYNSSHPIHRKVYENYIERWL